ncbi:MAG: DUF1365 domain-containing protein [Acidobacteria bacterium]|nr:DUF1365 domain-containing protein [Acidobacteriota bacterium]
MTATSAALRSHLLAGTIRHRRSRVTTYDFTHHVWYLALDLDELEEVDRRFCLLSVNRRNLLTVDDRDHLERGHEGLRDAIARRLWGHNLDPNQMRVTLIAYPRVLGYVFNPVSFYLCRDRDDMLRLVLAEVHNTHGDREVYDFAPVGKNARVFRGVADKRMYVSPFIGSVARYELLAWETDDRLTITIRECEGNTSTLFARLQVRRAPLTSGKLLRLLAHDPLVPLKTSALIFWHALRLWWRGVPWRRYPRARNLEVENAVNRGDLPSTDK